MAIPTRRLRDRVLDHGAGVLDTNELLLLLFDGAEVDDERVLEASKSIDAGGSPGVNWCADERFPCEAAVVLAAASELADRVANTVIPEAIRHPADAAAIARRELSSLRRERVIVIVCDSANRPIRTVAVSDGAIDRSMLPVREILNTVLRWDGRGFAIAHNHASGDPEPSNADVVATRQIAIAARVVGLRFLGHVVVGGGRWASVAT